MSGKSRLPHRRSSARMVDIWGPMTWRAAVARAVRRAIPAEVRKSLATVPAAKMHDDNARYLREALDVVGVAADDVLNSIGLDLREEFDSLRAFHACKPVSLASYYAEGLRPLTREWLHGEAISLFEGTIPAGEIAAAVAAADLETRESRVYFETDDEALVGLAGHYLVYGPESVNELWKDEARFRESQERQRGRGIPTLFECAVPLALLDPDDFSQLVRTLVTEYFRFASHEPPEKGERADWGFSIGTSLPPVQIVGHSHPAVISDPLRYFVDFKNPTRKCRWCTAHEPTE